MADQDSMLQETQDVFKSSQTMAPTMIHTSSGNRFAPKISTKLYENNFLVWNQKVEGVILSHKLHKIVANPQIPPMFKTGSERLSNIVSEEYQAWIIQDQTLFTWLIYTIYESFLPRVLSCKHAYEVSDKVYKHFHSQMKVRVCQLRAELKTIKKGNKSISQYVLRIREIESL